MRDSTHQLWHILANQWVNSNIICTDMKTVNWKYKVRQKLIEPIILQQMMPQVTCLKATPVFYFLCHSFVHHLCRIFVSYFPQFPPFFFKSWKNPLFYSNISRLMMPQITCLKETQVLYFLCHSFVHHLCRFLCFIFSFFFS